jgi:hypothetical protein
VSLFNLKQFYMKPNISTGFRHGKINNKELSRGCSHLICKIKISEKWFLFKKQNLDCTKYRTYSLGAAKYFENTVKSRLCQAYPWVGFFRYVEVSRSTRGLGLQNSDRPPRGSGLKESPTQSPTQSPPHGLRNPWVVGFLGGSGAV